MSRFDQIHLVAIKVLEKDSTSVGLRETKSVDFETNHQIRPRLKISATRVSFMMPKKTL